MPDVFIRTPAQMEGTMATYKRQPDGIRYHASYGRIMEHNGYATRIHWNTDMLDYLRRHYPTTLNEELAGCLGVSKRTMIRKARELGLEKDPKWLLSVWEERRQLARIVSKRKGYPGGFRKGERTNSEGWFKKGHKLSPDELTKKSRKIKQWYRSHPVEARAKAHKAWETRRKNMVSKEQ